ncbi:hypothetical protein C8J56DRAFT_1056402 [Mycena floridula]|nr:hypothetical protein C8J56DRAFT_1056402 [Mycena floridula]
MSETWPLTWIDQIIKATLQKEGLDDGGPSGDSTLPFTGYNVILCGDQHQFPPIANLLGALYCDLANDTDEGTCGRALYEQFTTVVSLIKQHRVDDSVWNDMLLRLRVGECTAEDVEMVKGQILEKIPTDFDAPPWNDVAFLTVRQEETFSLVNRAQIALMGPVTIAKLWDRKDIAIGMRVMVLFSIATEADVVNGSKAVIEDIILDPREPDPIADKFGRVYLKYPPALVIPRPENTSITDQFSPVLG